MGIDAMLVFEVSDGTTAFLGILFSIAGAVAGAVLGWWGMPKLDVYAATLSSKPLQAMVKESLVSLLSAKCDAKKRPQDNAPKQTGKENAPSATQERKPVTGSGW